MRRSSFVFSAAVLGIAASTSAGQLQTSGFPSNPPPNGGQEAALYQIDDGTNEDAIGTGGGTDVLWLNQFNALATAERITDIQVAFGTPASQTAATNGTPVRILLYTDADGGSTTNAVLARTIDTFIANANTTTLNIYDIPDIDIPLGGSFLIGALVRNTTASVNAFPAAWDSTAPHLANRSFIGFANPGTLDETNLASMGANYGALESFGPTLAGNWLVRANGIEIPEPSCLGLIGFAGLVLARRRRPA